MSTNNFSITSISFYSNQTVNQSMSSPIGKNTFIRYAQLIYVATLIILGVCGNMLCAIVFCTKSLRRIRSSAYLFVLALIDVFFLIDLLPGMIHTSFDANFYRKVHFICNLQTYISFVASFVHIWMVLAFTAERFFAVNFPLKHMSQCTPNVSRAVILIIILPAFVCYIHPAFFVSQVDDKGQCREKDGYERYLTNLNMIDTIMTMFLPFILVSILNILIIRKLFCSKTFRQHVFANGSRYQCRRTSNWPKKPTAESDPTASSTVTSPSTMSFRSQRLIRSLQLANSQQKAALYQTFTNSDSSTTNINNQSNSTPAPEPKSPSIMLKTKNAIAKRNESAQRHVLTELRLTKMLLAISLTCLSLNFPSYYLRFMFLYSQSQGTSSSEMPPSNDVDISFYRDIIFHYLSYLSYSINLVIYLLFGGNFRRALKHLFSLSSKRSDNFNSRLRGKRHYLKDKMYDYDSPGVTLTSPNSSLRSHSKSFKLREQANNRSTNRQQQKDP